MAVRRVPRSRRRLRRYTDRRFAPYVSALGQLALAWNDLQESLAELFMTLMMNGPPKAGDFVDYRPLWIWHSIQSDRSQRKMLKEVIEHSKIDWGRPDLKRDADWLISKAIALEDRRNDAIHSPLFLPFESALGPPRVLPSLRLLNPRARKLLKRRDLLSEFGHCRDVALILSDYAQEMYAALINPQRIWPDKPSLPNPTQKKGRQGRRSAPNPAFPQPQSSQT